mgnify:CR=1 FL=1
MEAIEAAHVSLSASALAKRCTDSKLVGCVSRHTLPSTASFADVSSMLQAAKASAAKAAKEGEAAAAPVVAVPPPAPPLSNKDFGDFIAASLAVACVTSARSLQLYRREGIIRASLGGPIALGALAGAVAGVHTVHLPGMSQVGQRVMGAILLLTAARFARDVARLRRGLG